MENRIQQSLQHDSLSMHDQEINFNERNTVMQSYHVQISEGNNREEIKDEEQNSVRPSYMQNPLSYLNSLGNNEDDSGDEDAGECD